VKLKRKNKKLLMLPIKLSLPKKLRLKSVRQELVQKVQKVMPLQQHLLRRKPDVLRRKPN
jgi:hypothetical protein